MNVEQWLLSFFDLLAALMQVPKDILEERRAVLQDDYVKYGALNGMKLRIYEVVTADDWVLQLWRVQNPDIYDVNLSAPVILCHGYDSSSLSYMLQTRNESSATILADNGFDVFLINFRGTQFGNRKISGGKPATPNASDYYRTGWQHMAEFDLPATVDFVLNETKQSKVYLSGDSMGGTIIFAFLSENHAYDDKISHAAAITPTLEFGEETKPIMKIASDLLSVLSRMLPQPLFGWIYGMQFHASTGSTCNIFRSLLVSGVCTLAPRLCFFLHRDLPTISSRNVHLNMSRAGVHFGRGSGGFTLITLYNYAIQFENDPWAKIDYDKIPQTGLTNQGEYNMDEPPVYDFAAVNVTSSLFFVQNDPTIGFGTARALAKHVGAEDIKFIEGEGLSHGIAGIATDSRCYIIDHFVGKISDKEAERDNARKEYRLKAAAFAKQLPFADGCIGKRE